MVAQEGGRYFFKWKPARQGDTEGKDRKPTRDKGFPWTSCYGRQLLCRAFCAGERRSAPRASEQAELQGRSSLERPALSGDWIQSEALRAIKSNASPACSCFPEARIRALGLSESEGQREQGAISECKGNQDGPRKSRM